MQRQEGRYQSALFLGRPALETCSLISSELEEGDRAAYKNLPLAEAKHGAVLVMLTKSLLG